MDDDRSPRLPQLSQVSFVLACHTCGGCPPSMPFPEDAIITYLFPNQFALYRCPNTTVPTRDSPIASTKSAILFLSSILRTHLRPYAECPSHQALAGTMLTCLLSISPTLPIRRDLIQTSNPLSLSSESRAAVAVSLLLHHLRTPQPLPTIPIPLQPILDLDTPTSSAPSSRRRQRRPTLPTHLPLLILRLRTTPPHPLLLLFSFLWRRSARIDQ